MFGFTLLRVRAHRLLFAAAALTVLLTTCVPAALAALTGAIGDAGLRQALEHRDSAGTTLQATAQVDGADLAATDHAVRGAIGRSWAGLPVRVTSSTRSGSYALPGRHAAGGLPRLTLFATLERSRLRLVSGGWPGAARGADGAVPVAVPRSAARELGVRTGSRLTLTDRLGGPPVRIAVTGLYRPADPASPYWLLDPLGGRGHLTQTFTTYGPLLVDGSVFTAGRLAPAQAAWQATADFRTATAGRIGALRTAVGAAVTRAGRGTPNGAVDTSSQLPALLDALGNAELAARSALLVDALELAVPAALALFLVAGVLAGQRTPEDALLATRGASRPQLAGPAVLEALLMAVPAAVLAPLLAGPLVALTVAHGALAGAGVRVGPDAAAWWTAAAVAVACAAAVGWPALRGAPRHGERRGGLPWPVRAGADLALLAVAAVAYAQLRGRGAGGGALSASAGGTLGVDPVLVGAPALCLLAGTVAALRLLTAAARLWELRAARGRGLAAGLAAWQLSRRPHRGRAPALLLVLAVALGVLALGQGASWTRSQGDQADFQAGTSVRVTGTDLPVFGQGGMYAALVAGRSGVTSATPVNRSSVPLAGDATATVLSADTATLASAGGSGMLLRPDLAGAPLARLLRPLYAWRTAPGARRAGGFPLPAGTTALSVTATLTATDLTGRQLPHGTPESINLTVTDRYGVPYGFLLGGLPADGRPHTLTARLSAGSGGSPAGPLRLTGVEADHDVPSAGQPHRLVLAGMRTVAAGGRTTAVAAPLAAGRDWRAVASLDDTDVVRGTPGYREPSARTPVTAPGTLTVAYDPGTEPAPATPVAPVATGELLLTAPAAPAPEPAAVATDAFLRASGTPVGGQVRLTLSGAAFTVRITGAVRALPTTGADGTDPVPPAGQDGGALLLDLGAVDQVLDARQGFALDPTEWWLTTAPGAGARVTRALAADGRVESLVSRDQVRAALESDPLGAGPRAVLPWLVAAAALLAAVGVAVGALGAWRERAPEYALLGAVGAPRGLLVRAVLAEQGLLALASAAAGVLLGTVLTRLVVPLVVLTSRATAPVPPLVVAGAPWPAVAAVAVLTALPALVLACGLAARRRTARREGGR